MTIRAAVVVLCSFLAACLAKPVDLTPAGAQIEVGKSDPAPGMVEIGPLTASHGHGCGGFGARGTHEGAYNTFKNKAAEMGATYARMDIVREPYTDGTCFHNEYLIRGVAFKQPQQELAPAAPSDPDVSADTPTENGSPNTMSDDTNEGEHPVPPEE